MTKDQEQKQPEVETVERTMNFDPTVLLKDGDCKFQSDMGGDIKLNLKYVR